MVFECIVMWDLFFLSNCVFGQLIHLGFDGSEAVAKQDL